MESKYSTKVSVENYDSNSRVYARGRNRRMSAQVKRRKVWVLVDLKRKSWYRDEVIKRLSESPDGVESVKRLYFLTGYSNITVFKNSVLQRLHDDELVLYDRVANRVTLTRLGWLVARHAAL